MKYGIIAQVRFEIITLEVFEVLARIRLMVSNNVIILIL